MTQVQAIRKIAHAFCVDLKRVLTPAQFRAVVRRNKREKWPHVCHSHDFCDANMVMAAAFRKVKGRPFRGSLKDSAIFNEAWTTAKTADFNY